MTVGVLEILKKAAADRVILFENGAEQMVEGRCAATIALAELERSKGYFDLGFATVQKLAAERSTLDPREVSEMLWVGRKLLDIPELKNAFQDGRISWTKLRTLVPHITPANAAAWIEKATAMTSKRLERAISIRRDPCIGGGPTQALILSVPAYKRFQQLAKGQRLEAGDKHLPDEECLMRLFDEIEAGREAASAARRSGASGTPGAPAPAAPAAVAPPPACAEDVVPVEQCMTQSRHIPAYLHRKVMNRARHACEVKGCRNRHGLEVHHLRRFSEGGAHSLENLLVLCHRCHAKWHREERRKTSPSAAACELTTRAASPGREEANPGEGEKEVPTANSADTPSRGGDAQAHPPGDKEPVVEGNRLDPSQREGAADAPATEQNTGDVRSGP